MFWKLLTGWCLLVLCVAIHAAGVTSALRWWGRREDWSPTFWGWTWLLSVVAGWMILLHLLEISVWAGFYLWQGAIADVQAAFYFSAVTYTTTGYGDVILPVEWRLVGGIEALVGILMCGWSTGFFFAVVSRLHAAGPRTVGP
jgi:hypothetical protein